MTQIKKEIKDQNNRPPGRIRIVQALRKLLVMKEFNQIRIADIAKTAEVTEPLIYKYFRDKRDLLHKVLEEYLENYEKKIEIDLKDVSGSLNKLRKIIWRHVHSYDKDRLMAKVLIFDVKGSADYYRSKPYTLLKRYNNIVINIINEGIEEGVIRDDVPVKLMAKLVWGSIDQFCMSEIVVGRKIDPDSLTENLCKLLFNAIGKI